MTTCVRCNNNNENGKKLCTSCYKEHTAFINKFESNVPLQDQLADISKNLGLMTKTKKLKRCRRCNDNFSKLKAKLCTECHTEHSAWINQFDPEKPMIDQLIFVGQ